MHNWSSQHSSYSPGPYLGGEGSYYGNYALAQVYYLKLLMSDSQLLS
jgi:hypothetical protein